MILNFTFQTQNTKISQIKTAWTGITYWKPLMDRGIFKRRFF